MNKRLLVALVVLAAVLLLLVLLLRDQDSPPSTSEDGAGPSAPVSAGPQLEAHGSQPLEADSPAPVSPEPVPVPEPERPVDASGVRVRLAGRVLDPKGRPVSAAPVRVYAYFDATMRDVALHAEGSTDVDGRFALDFHPRATVTNRDPYLRLRLAAFHPTWVMGVTQAYVDTREIGDEGYAKDDIEVRMRPAFHMVCHVRDEDGRPVAGATCALEQFYGRKRWVDGRDVVAVTDDEGTARLHLPHLGDHVILLSLHGHNAFRVSAPGFATVYARVQVPDETTPDYVSETTVVLPAPHEIRGRLLDDEGRPITDAAFSLTGRRKGEWGMLVQCRWADHALQTDEVGGFIVPAVPFGTWRLEFEAEGYRRTRLDAETGAADLEVRLVRKAAVVFLFRDVRTGRFLGAQEYDLTYEDGGGSRTSGGPADVRVEFDDLPPGKHTLRVQFAGRAQPFETTFEAVPGVSDPIVFDVPAPTEGVTVEGRVTDPEGQPLKQVWMTLSPPAGAAAGDEEDDDEGAADLEWVTPEDGTFRFEGLAPGRYTLELDADEFATRRMPIEVGEESPAKPLRVVLTRGSALRVVFPPVPAEEGWTYDVRVRHASGLEVDGRFMGKGERDAVVFLHQPPGETWVTLETSQFRTRRFEGDPFTRRVVLEEGRKAMLSFEDVRPVRVRGRVEKADGKPLEAGNLQLRRIGPALDLSEVHVNVYYGNKSAQTNETGHFSFGGLLPGRYAVTTLTKGGVALTFEVGDASIEDLVLTCGR